VDREWGRRRERAPGVGFSPLHSLRLLAARLELDQNDIPLLLLDRPAERGVDPLLGSSAAVGGLLCEGIGDAVQIHAASASESRSTAFSILQAARVRITRTEFISCPSCGRTLFDLEETTARIRARTSHLKGVKIALFVGREMVAKDIPTAEADERLIDLIKQHDRWVDP
jgi:(E)-4-hydroxy-3-methylbut-2-enyl-diphosphate synthase